MWRRFIAKVTATNTVMDFILWSICVANLYLHLIFLLERKSKYSTLKINDNDNSEEKEATLWVLIKRLFLQIWSLPIIQSSQVWWLADFAPLAPGEEPPASYETRGNGGRLLLYHLCNRMCSMHSEFCSENVYNVYFFFQIFFSKRKVKTSQWCEDRRKQSLNKIIVHSSWL